MTTENPSKNLSLLSLALLTFVTAAQAQAQALPGAAPILPHKGQFLTPDKSYWIPPEQYDYPLH